MTSFKSGFPKIFFQMTPFIEIKKAMAPFNKITQKHLTPFFVFISICHGP